MVTAFSFNAPQAARVTKNQTSPAATRYTFGPILFSKYIVFYWGMKHRLQLACVVSLLVCTISALAQSLPRLDAYPQLEQKIKVLDEFITANRKNGQVREALAGLQVGVQLAKAHRIDTLLTQYLYFTGYCYKQTSQYDSCLYFLKRANQLAKRQNDFKYQARIGLERCNIYEMLGQGDSLKIAMQQLEATIPHLATTSWETASYWIRKGHNAYFLAQFDQSLSSYQNALQVFQHRKDSLNMAVSFFNIGRVHKMLKNVSAAITYLKQANGLYVQLDVLYHTGQCNFEIGNVFNHSGYLDSAKVYYQKAYHVARAYENNYLLVITLRGMGEIIKRQPDGYRKAKKIFLEALHMARTEELKYEVKNAYYALGEIEFEQDNFVGARKNFEQGLQIALEVVIKDDVLLFYQKLSLTEAALRNFALAYRYQKLVNQYKDSIYTEKSGRVIAEMETKYQTRQKQQQIALLDEQNKSQRLQLAVQQRNQILPALGILLTGLVGFITYRRYQLRKKLEMEQVRSRIAADFHDELGANLSSIALYSDMLRANRSTEAVKKTMLEHISHNARSTISAINDLIWTIKPDNDPLEHTIVRMKEYAFPLLEASHIAFDFEVSHSLKKLQLAMNTRKFIYLIFKEAINNALKYAQATRIKVMLYQLNDRLRMSIQDNGKGFDFQTSKTGNGLGNMNKRALELGGTLRIDSSLGKGTHIELDFKLVEKISLFEFPLL